MTAEYHRNALKPGYRLQWYEIRRILGQGGFGITYLAHDTNLDQEVAIKEYLPIELAVRENDATVQPATGDFGQQYNWGLDRFIAEAKTLAKFKHPNIVRVFSVFEANNTAYMIMEYEQGHSLQEILGRRKTLDEPELVRILYPILDGLQQVHDAGFIHRDIKPGNIFVREDGSPVLLDFGSARQAIGTQTKTLTTLVSPGYAPIEQYYSKSDEQGPWTDIYSLAATMYRAVTGRVPLDAVDRSKSLLERSEDSFVSLEQITPGLCSERFLKAIDHGLMFRQQDRPQSIQDWKRDFDLEHYRAGIDTLKTFEERPTQPGTRMAPAPVKKKRTLAYLFATGMVLLIIGGTYLYSRQSRLPDPETDVITGPEPMPAVDPAQVLREQQAEQERLRQEQAALAQQAEAERLEQERRVAEEQRQAALEAEALRRQQEIAAEKKRLEEERLKLEQERESIRRQQEESARLDAERKKAEEERRKQELLAAEKQRLEAERLKLQQEKERIARQQLEMAAQKAEEERLRELQQCRAGQGPVPEPERLRSGTLYYAAIAIGANNGWGESWGFVQLQQAEQVALENCRMNDSNCQVEVWSNHCLAFARGADGAAGWAWSETLNEARRKALGYCEEYTECCTIATAFCADELE